MRPHQSLTATAMVIGIAGLLLACSTPQPADQDPHRDLFGIGVFWSDWLDPADLPAEFAGDPRGYDRAQLDLIVSAGGTATHGSFDWAGLEPVQGTYEWSRFDQRVEDAVDRGLRVYAYLGNTPDWATPPGSVPGYRTPPAEEYRDDFEAYVRAVGERYAGVVEHFFFWNEPNGCSWVNDGCSNSNGFPLYTTWLKRAHTALKLGNPDAVLAAGSLDYGEYVPTGYQYLEGMYQYGAKGFFEAFDIHPYAAAGLHWDAIGQIRRVLDEHGDHDVEIWISEYGWPDSVAADAPARLVNVLDTLSSPAYATVTYARYLVVSDLGDGSYGLATRELATRPIFDAFAAYPKSDSR